jgi:hypothetical protein
MHIDNLYKDQTIFLLRECYALEKLDGTSAMVRWRDGQVWLHSGGSARGHYNTLFDLAALTAAFQRLGHASVTVKGEAYGGPHVQAHVSARYGDRLRFAAFLVEVGEARLSVPQGHDVVTKLGLEHVHYARIPATAEAADAERDAPSVQSKRNGVEGDKPREGVVLRPLVELRTNDGRYIIAKHKRDEERETATPRPVVDPAKLMVLEDAAAIALEWVTEKRLEHVLSKIEGPLSMRRTSEIVNAMIADVLREGAGELIESKEALRAIGTRTSWLFSVHLRK